ncbi:MAG: SRPBCC family protein [Actinobacteria bacterium]|nr:SRPBCC family protein [Actinomycetota bacterium]
MSEPVSDDPVVITRDVDLDVPADELWQLVADGERWTEWLTEESEVVVQPAQHGTVVDDDGIERQVTIESVVPGERVRFAWWPSDRPDESSTVELVVAPLPWIDGDRSRLSVIETYARASATSTRPRRWDVRLMLFALRLDAVALARRA